MKKGDLVLKRTESQLHHWTPDVVPDFETAVVLTDPYAAVFTQTQESGEPVFSIEKLVVDILAENRVIQKCPVDAIIKASKAGEGNTQ